MEYVLMPKPEGCIFCQKLEEGNDEANLILLRGKANLVMMNLFPYNPGHLMVAPYRHTSELQELTQKELVEHFDLVRRMVSLLREASGARGFNIGLNLGEVAGAGVAEHVHTHIVPRWLGDTNFMPVTAGTKVIPEGVAATYRKLKKKLSRWPS
jgi:ATP adenylyltransferase